MRWASIDFENTTEFRYVAHLVFQRWVNVYNWVRSTLVDGQVSICPPTCSSSWNSSSCSLPEGQGYTISYQYFSNLHVESFIYVYLSPLDLNFRCLTAVSKLSMGKPSLVPSRSDTRHLESHDLWLNYKGLAGSHLLDLCHASLWTRPHAY